MRLAGWLAVEGEQEIAHAGQRQRQVEAECQPQNPAAVGIEGSGVGDPHQRRGVAPFDLQDQGAIRQAQPRDAASASRIAPERRG